MDKFPEEVLLEEKVSILPRNIEMPSGLRLKDDGASIGGMLYLKQIDEVIGHCDEYAIQLVTPLFKVTLGEDYDDKQEAEKEFLKIKSEIEKGNYHINLEVSCKDVLFGAQSS